VTIEYYKTVFDYAVYGYCVMPDHLHLLIKPTGPFDLSYIMKMIKGSFARKINKLGGKNGSIWQRRFYDQAIRSEQQFLAQLAYIHQNPVAGGLVTSAQAYPFSSFNQYMNPTASEREILQIDHL
jgi:putative transposase